MIKIKYLLSLNRYSRNGRKNNNPKGIVLHHCENDCYGAIETRNYFDGLKAGKNAVYYSTHYIVGFNGEVIYCVPEAEVSNHRGNCDDSAGFISITCCNIDKCIEPGNNSRAALKALVRDIIKRYKFDIDSDFLRHYDISGIKCPRYYAENKNKWEELKKEIKEEIKVAEYLEGNAGDIVQNLSETVQIDKTRLLDIILEKMPPDISEIKKIFEKLKNDNVIMQKYICEHEC